ncbi:protein kinase domain-containing protein [Nonomuraea helvata]|uniref:non-specific serine/threonine protein kinase n=1 Tax=Nonomuraea helvata TaxID=37484 RepID=A0ABV5S3Z6_9ACTN
MPNVEPLREGDPATVGPYRLVGRLGAGGHGVVYLGQARNGTPVAVKVLREGLAGDDRLAREIAAARKVEPFCLAQVLDASTSGRPYIVSEYVDGPSLQQAGRQGGAELQRIAVSTATALDAIHQAGVVHGDFKPSNVLLGPGGPQVVDFGIAGALAGGMKATGTFVGTPAYMAPEQLSGKAVGAPADVFAWASVMVFAATGTPPFGDDSLPTVINRILNDEPHLGELRGLVREIMLACLAKDPSARPVMRDVLLRLTAPSRQPAAPSQSPAGQQTPVPYQTSDQAPLPRRTPGAYQTSDQSAAAHQTPVPYQTSDQPSAPYQAADPSPASYETVDQPAAAWQQTDQPAAAWHQTPEPAFDQDTPPRRGRAQGPGADGADHPGAQPGAQPGALPRRFGPRQSPDQPAAPQPAPGGHFGQEPAGHYGQEPAAHYGQDPAGHYGQEPPAHYGQQPAGHHGQEPAAHYGQEPAAHFAREPAGHYGHDPGAHHGQGPAAFPLGAPVVTPVPAEFEHQAEFERAAAREQPVPEPAMAQHSALVGLLAPGDTPARAPAGAPGETPAGAPAPPRRSGRRRMKIVLIAGASGVSVLALAGAIMWLTPTTPTAKSVSVASSTPSASKSAKSTPSQRPKRTRTPGASPQSEGDPSTVPTDGTTSTAVPDASGQLRLVYVRAGGTRNGDCWSGGEVTLQALVQRTGEPLNFRYTWYIDRTPVGRSSATISENGQRYLAAPQSLQSNGGVHRVTLRITSPIVTQRTISVTMCQSGTN